LLESALVVDERFGITNDIDEQDVTDFELNFRFGLRRHSAPQAQNVSCSFSFATLNHLSRHSLARRRKGEGSEALW
jgi:hypothetical protein